MRKRERERGRASKSDKGTNWSKNGKKSAILKWNNVVKRRKGIDQQQKPGEGERHRNQMTDRHPNNIIGEGTMRGWM